jgi:uncharacterized protein YecT (DUF1311 family)
MRALTIGVLLVLSLPLTTHASSFDETVVTKEFSRCMENASGSTEKILVCITTEKKLQDVRLNMAYKQLKTKVNPDQKHTLLIAQRAWLLYRDLNCKSYAQPGGGDLAIIRSRDCVRYHTAIRARELERFDQH